jgi:predicted ester cyclase
MFMGMFHAAFPGAHVEVSDLIAENDRVVGRWTFTGTHRGEFLNIPPTDRPVKIEGIDGWRVANNMLVEHWDAYDQLGMMQQLGVIPKM